MRFFYFIFKVNQIAVKIALYSLILFFSNSIFAQEDPILKYGISQSAPIDQGFFFCDGQYVESPYRVERRGLEIFINGKKVGNTPIPADWRYFEDPGTPPVNLKPPDFLPDINDTYWSKKYRYHLTKYKCNQTSATLEYIKAIRQIPGIKLSSEKVKSVNIINLVYSNGDRQKITLITRIGRLYEPYPTREDLISSAEKTKKFYFDFLKRNDAIISVGGGIRSGMGYRSALNMISALLASDIPEKRYAELKKYPINLDKDPSRDMLSNMLITPQLKSHYEKIKTEIGQNAQKEKDKVFEKQKTDAFAWAKEHNISTETLKFNNPIPIKIKARQPASK